MIKISTPFRFSLHIFALFNLVIAYPLFDLLSKKGIFFTAHNISASETIVFVVFLSFVIPLFLILIELLFKRYSFKALQIIHTFFIACFIALFLGFTLGKYPLWLPFYLFLCLTTGVLFAICYQRISSVKSFFDLLTPAIIIVPFLFFYNSQTLNQIFNQENASQKKETPQNFTKNPIPVILIVFDEFPALSLLNEENKVDPVRYPNFYSLSKQSHWFRKATTVGAHTGLALTALFTGKHPEVYIAPNYETFPKNLFTLLGSSYQHYAYEFVSQCCPRFLNKVNSSPFYKRFTSLLIDAFVVQLHLITPSTLNDKLPVINDRWTGFTKWTRSINERTLQILKKSSFPKFKDTPFVYMHFPLPHQPWTYLPSGNIYFYDHPPGANPKDHKWLSNEWQITQAYQRHLLQVGFTDKILGDLIDLFKNRNLYDRSLFIVLADHGIGFTPNEGRRDHMGKLNYLEIMNVPLFIKLPFQNKEIINDQFVDIIDILPTIADVIGLTLPWPVEGTSVFSPNYPKKDKVYILSKDREDNLIKNTYSPQRINKDLDIILQRKIDSVGSGSSKTKGLYQIGAFPELIGIEKNDLSLKTRKDLSVEFKNFILKKDKYQIEELTPNFIKGYLKGPLKKKNPSYLAILVNDTIQSLTQTYTNSKGRETFTALIPVNSLKDKNNNIEVLLIEKSSDGLQLFTLKDSTFNIDKRFIYSIDPKKTFVYRGDLSLFNSDVSLYWNAFLLDSSIFLTKELDSLAPNIFLKKRINGIDHSLLQSKHLKSYIEVQSKTSKEINQQISIIIPEDLPKVQSKPGWVWWREEEVIFINHTKKDIPIKLFLTLSSHEIDRQIYFVLNSQHVHIDHIQADGENEIIINNVVIKPGENEFHLHTPYTHTEVEGVGGVWFSFKKDSLLMGDSIVYEIPCQIETKTDFILRYYPALLPLSSNEKEFFIGKERTTLKAVKNKQRDFYEGTVTLTKDTDTLFFKKTDQLNDFIEMIPLSKQALHAKTSPYNEPNLNYEKISDTSYKVKVKTDSEFVLIFSKPYKPKWKAYTWLNGEKKYFNAHGKFRTFDFVNGYYIDQVGQYDIWVENKSQKLQLAKILALIFIGLCCFLLFTSYLLKRNRPAPHK